MNHPLPMHINCLSARRMLLLTALFSLLCTSVRAQSPSPESLAAEGRLAEAAAAFTDRGSREDLFQAAYSWYGLDSFARCRQLIEQLAHTEDGELIIDSLSGLAYHMAGMSYYEVYDDINAIPNYLQAIDIRDACYAYPHFHQAHTRYNLANSMHWIGRPDTATYLLREAIDIYDQLPDKDSTNWLRSLKLLSVIARESNDVNLLQNATIAMVNLVETFTKPSLIDQLQVYHDASINFQHLKDFPASVSAGENALVAARKRGDIVLAADILNTMAGSYELSGDMERARKTYHQSIDYLKSINGDPSSIGIAYYNLAHSYSATQQYQKALSYIETAGTYPHNQNPNAPVSHENMYGEILAGLDRKANALDRYAKALRLVAEGDTLMQNGLLTVVPDSVELLKVCVDVLANRTKLLIKDGKLQAALTDMNTIFALLDLLRERVNSDGSRYAISEGAWQYFDLAIGLHWQLYSVEHNDTYLQQAFALSERARAYSLLTALNRQVGSMSTQEQNLRREIATLEREAVNNASMLPALADRKLKLDLLLRTETPTSLSSPSAPDMVKLRSLLATENLDLIEYHLGPKRSFRFHLSAGGKLQVTELPGADSIRTLVTSWREAIAAGAYRQKSLRSTSEQTQLDQRFLDYGLALKALLLPPLEEVEGNRICFVPDGSLHFLPFAALPLASAQVPLDYRDLHYLQNDYSLQLAFSAGYLLELEEQLPAAFQENLLAFAPSFAGEASAIEISQLRGTTIANSVRIGEAPEATSLPALAPLKHNRSEVVAIADLLPKSQTFLDGQATRRAFLEAVNKPPRILHLSSHGLANPEAPNLSFIAFAQAGEKLEEEELLYFNDLSTLPLQSELVVLSACETSLGALAPGESVMSLGSAFAAAGARSTLTSLWKVDDAATERLMIDFYAKLAAGEERAQALGSAQERQRENGEFAHPYYWSAMTLNGRAGPIALEANQSAFRLWYLLGGLALLLILWGWMRKKTSPKLDSGASRPI